MQGIYNCIPETNPVSRVYTVVAVLYLQFVLHVIYLAVKFVLYCYISTSRRLCAVSNMAVYCNS
jgi:hypothetical protein